ncbi:Hypothetical predicted protein [Pelobates cultripes]|uniref:Uncharacterized protein n=1 Tax=Pelobates cultripes TaxID=61616 RepID=A0AAD1S674_PELCU|nr:Hypothetical predicted protein [Pelobates cultripes]
MTETQLASSRTTEEPTAKQGTEAGTSDTSANRSHTPNAAPCTKMATHRTTTSNEDTALHADSRSATELLSAHKTLQHIGEARAHLTPLLCHLLSGSLHAAKDSTTQPRNGVG